MKTNMNMNYVYEYGEMGSFWKSLKIEKTITYALTIFCWTEVAITKEGPRGFLS